MRATRALIAVATSGVLFTPALAQPPGPRPAPGPQRSAPDIIRALEGQGYRDFRKIAREHGLYEVKALNGHASSSSTSTGPPGRFWRNRSAARG